MTPRLTWRDTVGPHQIRGSQHQVQLLIELSGLAADFDNMNLNRLVWTLPEEQKVKNFADRLRKTYSENHELKAMILKKNETIRGLNLIIQKMKSTYETTTRSEDDEAGPQRLEDTFSLFADF